MVFIGDGSEMKVIEIELVRAVMTMNGKHKQMTLKDVLLVSQLSYNLISVSKRQMNGLKNCTW